MILKRFYDENLAQASYLIGCPGAGEACVVDPNRDVDAYVAAAAGEGLRISAVTETHIHADYLSGARELASVTGATLYLSDEGDKDWKYGYSDEPNVKLVRHGDHIRVGGVRLDVVKTPGHTPEHVSFVLTDEPTSSTPLGALTGDFIFAGDVGRPDLLESAAGVAGTMEPSARQLFQSIRGFAAYPDHLLVWPGHGSGSACGKSLGGVPVSSLGYERASNWALQIENEDSFVREVLTGQPEPPRYFAMMKKMNKEGPALLNGIHVSIRHLDGECIPDRIADGDVVLDVRDSSAYGESHIPGTLHIPLNKGFTNWAGWLVPYDRDIWIIAETDGDVRTAARNLAMIGLDRFVGWYGPEALQEFRSQGGMLEGYRDIAATDVSEESILDVRSTSEWSHGHVPGAHHIPLGYLADRSNELPQDRTIAVHCHGGARSPIAMSLLLNLGFKNIVNVEDGFMGFEELSGRGCPAPAGS